MTNFIILTSLLGGSLGTLIIKELLNQFNKKQDFIREIKINTYLRKLEKAENATAFYWTYLNRVTEMKKSLEFIIKAVNEEDERDYDIEIIHEILVRCGQEISELSNQKYSNINSVHLYFDLEDTDKWNETDMENLLLSLSETKALNNEILFWSNLYDSAVKENDRNKADYYWEKGRNVLPIYLNSLQKFIDSIERNKEAIHQSVRLIKKQMKHY